MVKVPQLFFYYNFVTIHSFTYLLFQDKKYYPTAQEVYGPDVEVLYIRYVLVCFPFV